MLLTCPTCRSALQVPDGTLASVRCPTCRTVFSSAAPPPPPPEPPPPAAARPRFQLRPAVISAPVDEPAPPRPAPPVESDEDAPPRPRALAPHADDEDRPRRFRDSDDEDRPPRRPRDVDDAEARPAPPRRPEPNDDLTEAERREQKAQYARGMWGCRLIQYAFTFQAFALMVILMFLVKNAVLGPTPALIVVAGLLGLCNWGLGAAGTVLCLTSRPVPGLFQVGGAAAAAVVIHGVFLLALMSKRGEGAALLGFDLGDAPEAWAQLPTKLDSLTLYMTTLVYQDERFIPKGMIALTFLAGIAECVRLVLIMVTLSYLARAAGDQALAYRCARAAGIGSFGPVGLAIAMLLMMSTLIETGAADRQIGVILATVFVMGVYAMLAGMLVPSIVAAREASEACEFPFQAATYDLAR